MLKNKMIVKKIRNIVILLMAIIIMFGAYKNIDRSRAEDVIEIGAIAIDNYGYLENESFILEAQQIDDDIYEIELPESVNGKKINQIIKVTLEDIVPEVITENAVIENASTENEVTETPGEQTTIPPEQEEQTEQQPQPEAEPEQETQTEVEQQPEAEQQESEGIEVIENKIQIQLSKEELDSKQINIEVVYDVAILEKNEEGTYQKNLLVEKTEEERQQIEITEETEMLYSKILRYEDEENNKLVELRGYLPIDAELQVEEVTQEKITEIFGETKINVAYDIKIIRKIVTQVPVDEANPESEIEEIVEIIEINPEEFAEKCEVTITDANIAEKSQVYHVKEDNTYEKVNVNESTKGNVNFEAQTFSIYAVGEEIVPDEGIETGADPGKVSIRYSLDGGSTYTAWQENVSITVPMPESGKVVVQVKCGNSVEICINGDCNNHHYTGIGGTYTHTITTAGGYKYYGYNYDGGHHSANVTETSDITIIPSVTTGFCFEDGAQYIADTTADATGAWTNKNVYARRKGGVDPTCPASGFTTQISQNNSTWANYSFNNTNALYVMSTEGTHKRYFRAKNGSVNTKTVTLTARIDKTNPTGTISSNRGEYTNQSTITVYVTASDALSGIKSVAINGWYGTGWVTYHTVGTVNYDSTNNRYYATFTFNNIKDTTTGNTSNGDGNYTFDAHVTDNAGNTFATNGITVLYDTTAPEMSFSEIDIEKNGLVGNFDAYNNTGSGHNNSTTTWKELSGASDGKIKGGTWGTDHLSLDGVDDWVNLGQANITKSFTLEATIVPETIQTNSASIIGNYDAGGVDLKLYNGIPQLVITKADGSGNYTLSTGTALAAGTKYHIVGTYDGSIAKIYINGSLTKSGTVSTTVKQNTGAPFALGCNPSLEGNPDGNYGNIKIYSARIYNTALTQTQIQSNRTATNPTGVVTSGLIRNVDGTNNTGSGHSSSISTWKDLSESTNGKLTGGTWTEDYLTLDGVDDWVNLGYGGHTNKITAEATVAFNEFVASGYSSIISNANSGGYGIYVWSDGRPFFEVWIPEAGGYKTVESTEKLVISQKYHIAGTYDGTTIKLYVNGVLKAQTAVTGTIKSPNDNTVLAIGANPDGTTAGDGCFANMNIYSARLYNTALTQEQIVNNYKIEEDKSWAKTHSVTVTLSDALSGIASGASIKYGWSLSRTTAPESYTTATLSYTAGATSTTFTATGSGITGKYYLWVVPTTLKDRAGNSKTTNLISTKQFLFDNTNPYWTAGTPTIDTTNKTVTVEITGTDDHSGYKSNSLDTSDIAIYIDGEYSNVTTTLSAATPIANGVKYTLTIRNFEEELRRSGKLYKEWSGNVTINIAADTLTDIAGNVSVENNLDAGFVDFIKPEITYQYSNADIDYEAKTVQMVFSVTDKYFNQSTLAIGDLIIKIDEENISNVSTVTKTLTKSTTPITETRTKSDGTTETVTIGYTYTLLLEELEQDAIATGKKYLDYSGIVTVEIPEGKVLDTSNNTNDAEIITLGINEPGEGTGETLPSTAYTTPYLPTGFGYDTSTNLSNGLTIQDGLGNQYVWIIVPRDDTVYNDLTDDDEDDLYGDGTSVDSTDEDILSFDPYNLTEENLSAIETELQEYAITYTAVNITDTWYSEAQSGFATADDYNAHKNQMLKSVFKNGGFYVGKYETGIADTEPDVIDTNHEARTRTGNAIQTPVIQANAYPYNYVTPTQAQGLASSLGGEGYTTSLMFYLQWSLIVKHLEISGAATIDELTASYVEWGNYEPKLYSTNSKAKYYISSWADGAYEKTTTEEVLLSTGASTDFQKGGIYDLIGNVDEMCLGFVASSATPELGGSYNDANADFRFNWRASNYNSSLNKGRINTGFRVALWQDIDANPGTPENPNGVIADVVDPLWTIEEGEIETEGGASSVTLQVTDKYFASSTLTQNDIELYVGGVKQTGAGLTLGTGVELKEDRDGDGTEETVYGIKYPVTFTLDGGSGYTTFTDVNNSSIQSQYRNAIGNVELKVLGGKAADTSGNTAQEKTFELGNLDTSAPEVIYKYSQTTYDPIANTITVIFDITDKYYSSSTLEGSHITATIGGTTISSKTLTSANLTANVDGANKVVGKRYTLVLSPGEKTGKVNITIPAGKVSDSSGRSNATQTINVGIDLPAGTGTAQTIDLINPTVSVSPTQTTNASASNYVKTQNITITLSDDYSGIATTGNTYNWFLSTSSTPTAVSTTTGTYGTYTSGTQLTIGSGLTGTYYLYVKAVTDNSGNISTANGTVVTVAGATYHRFGVYKFDNTAPNQSYLTMLLGSASGTAYAGTTSGTTFTGNWTNQSVYITPNGSDAHSGVGSITYTVNAGSATTAAQTLDPGEGAEATYTVKVTVTDKVGNTTTSGDYIIRIDKIDPTLTITADKTSPTNASSITYTIQFSEAVTGFTADDITLTATQNKATKGTFTTVTEGLKYTLVVNTVDDVEETVTVSVPAGKCVDKAQNGNVAETSTAIVVDRIDPTLTITANKTSPTNASSITYTFTFSEPVTGFATGDITLTASQNKASKGTFTAVSSTEYTLVVNTVDDVEETVTVSVAAGKCVDKANNGNVAATSSAMVVDRIDPTLTITADKTSPTNASSITYTFEFSEAVTGFATGDITLSASQNKATKGTFTAVSSTKYTLVVNTVDEVEETLTVSVAAGKCIDKAGNGNVAKTSTAIVVDRIDPTLTITANKTSPTNASSITYTFTFSEPVTGFATGDITLSATQNKATKGTFTTVTEGLKYTLVVNTVDDVEETVTVSVAAGKCVDKANNGNVAATSTAIVVDRIDPTLTITADKTSPTNASSITYTFEFSEAVTGFATGDITLSASQNKATKGTFTAVSSTKYTLVVNTVDDVEETLTLSVAAGKCVDKAQNGNVAATSTAIVVDRIDPTLTITANRTSPTNASTITYTFEFSEAVTEFVTGDITLTASQNKATKGTFTAVSSTKYTLVVNTVDNIEETITVSVAASKCIDKAGNGNVAKTSTAIVADRIDPTWTYVSKDIYYSTANDAGNDNYANADRTIKITFKGTDANGHNVTSSLDFGRDGNNANDIQVKVNGEAVPYEDITLYTANSGPSSQVTYTLTIENVTGDGTLDVQIPAGTLTDHASNTNTVTNMTTDVSITIDNTSPSLSFAVTSPATGYYKAGQVITITATYNEDVYKEITSNTLITTKANAPTMSLTFGGATAKGTATCTSVSGRVFTYTYTIQAPTVPTGTDGDNGTMVISSFGTVYDRAGNAISATNVTPAPIIRADTIAPTVTSITPNVTSPTNAASITYTVVFSEAVTGFAASDVTVNSGKGSVTSVTGSGTTWSVVVSTTDNQEYTETITIKANGSTIDVAGNKILVAETSDDMLVDRIDPTLTITANKTSPTNAASITYTFTFSEAVTGFATGDITFSASQNKATKGTFTAVSSTVYTLVVNTVDNVEETISVGVAANKCIDKAGNGNVKSSPETLSIVADRIEPTWTYVSKDIYYATANDAGNDNYANNGRTIKITFKGTDTNGHNVTSSLDFGTDGNNDNDIQVKVNGTAVSYSNMNLSTTGSGTSQVTCVLTLTGITGDGAISVAIPAGTLTDEAANSNILTSLSTNITIDNTSATVSFAVTSPTTAGYYKAGQVITITATYSEDVYAEITSNTLINTSNAPAMTLKFGDTASVGTATCTNVSGRVLTYTYTIQAPTTATGTNGDNGLLKITSLGTVYDRAGNSTTQTTEVTPNPQITADTIAPVVTSITANRTSPTNAGNITYTVVFSEGVTGFAASDVTVNSGKGSVTSVDGSGTTWTVVVSTTDDQEYTETITIKANGATIDRAGNKVPVAKTSDGLVVDRIDPTWTYVSKDIYLTNPNDVGNDNYANANRTVVIVFKGTDANGHNVTSTLTSNAIEVTVVKTDGTLDTTVANANKSLATVNNGTSEVTCTLTIENVTGDGILNVVIPEKVTTDEPGLTDWAGNMNAIPTNMTIPINITIDNTKPTISFAVTSPAAGYYKAGQVITITATYNDTNIAAGIFADQKSTTPITTANAPAMTLSFGNTAAKGTVTCTNVNGRVLTYTYTIQGATPVTGTNGDNGVLKITSLGTVYDAAGNSISQTTTVTPSPQITADTILPTLTITSNKTSYTNSANITYTFTFSENVTGFTADDVTVANGTKGTFTAVSGTVYTLVVSTIDDTVYTENISVAADVCIDIAGNGNVVATPYTINVDRKDPVITATPDKTTNATANNYQKSQNVTITVTDEGAGLLSSNSYQYFLSSSATSLSGGAWTGGSWTNYTSGTAFTIGTGLTGDYYLFVKTVKDNVTDTNKNISNTSGTMKTIDGTTYHMFGTYKFDNTNPYWIVGTPSIDYTNKKVTVDIIGTDDHSGYKANTLDTGDIEVWVDGTKITNVDKELSTASTVAQGIKYTLTLTDFEEDARQTGKKYKEWSGTTDIVIIANTLEDNLGNKNTLQDKTTDSEFSLGHIDLVDPEFTYQYSETVINKTSKIVTVVFYAADKYLDTSESGIALSDFYNPNTDAAAALTTKPVFAVDGEPININVAGNSLTPETLESGKVIKYTLVVANLQANPNVEENSLNDGYTYSGIVSISLPADKFIDSSDNGNEATVITVGTNELDGEPNAGVSGGVVVDVVTPVWKLDSVSLDTGVIKLQAIDKYFNTCTIDEDDITVIVNGVPSTAIVKDITSTTPTDIKDTVNGVANTVVGKEYTLKLSNITPTGGGYKTFTPTNLSELDASTTDGSYAYKYKSENGGNISIQIAAGTITDKSGNSSVQQKFEVGNIDVTKPELYEVRKTQSPSGNTETIVFNVTDRNYDYNDLVEKTEITLWFDNVQLDALRNGATLTQKEIWGIPEGTTESVRLGHQYTLVIPNIAQTTKQSGKDYLEYSGTLKMTVAETAAKDFNGNKLNTSTTTLTDFIDYLKPQMEQVAVATPINTSAKTYTMQFKVIDKYLYNSDASSINMITGDEITVYVDGEEASSITKSLTSTPITATMNKTVNGAVTSVTNTIGHTYTLVLGGFEQSSKQGTKTFMEWSGTVKAVIAQNATADTTGNTFDADETKRTLTGEHVDFIKPVLEEVNTTRGTNNETIVFNVMDKYLADSNTNVISTGEITVYVDGEEVDVDYTNSSSTGLNGVLTKVQNFTHTVNGNTSHIVGQQYQLVLSGFEQASRNAKDYKDYSGTVTMEITQNAVADTKGNTLDAAVAKRTVTGDFVDFIKPQLEYTHSSSDINHGTKTYTMTFDVTDKYYNDVAANVLTLDDLTITMGSEYSGVNDFDLKALANQGKVNIAFSDAEKTATFNKTVGGVVETTATSHMIGHTYTLTISNLDQLEIASGDKTVNYSGIITVVVAQNQLSDTGPAGNGTSPNQNVETQMVSGVNVPGGSGSGVVVDVVSPLFDKVSSSAYAFNPSNKASSIGTIEFKATDRYFVEGSGITADDIQVVVDGSVVSTGITKRITDTEVLTEDRIISGTPQDDVQYGVKYTLEITGWAQNAHQVKIRIPAEKLTDQYGNKNILTDLIVYNCLELTSSEIASNSGFLGNTNIDRQDVHNVTFLSNVSGAPKDASGNVNIDNNVCWDVSARNDKSIIAWRTASAPYTVYIGSDDEIFANQNSTCLFAYIGYGSSSTATETITNIGSLNVRSVTNMTSMFEGCGADAMTTFTLGSNFNTSNVTKMGSMFKKFGKSQLASLSLGTQFFTNEVTDMSSMFEECGTTAMTSLILGSNFNTTKVTTMDSMFKNCTPKITSIDLGTQFDTSIVTDMGSMFEGFGTTSLTSLDLGNSFYTYKVTVTDMNNMFNGCGTTSMTVLDLGPAFTKISTNHTDFMKDCGKSTLVIYAPEAIYLDRTTLKTN